MVSHHIYCTLRTSYGEDAASFHAQRDIPFAMTKQIKLMLDDGFVVEIGDIAYSWTGEFLEINTKDVVCSDKETLLNWKRMLWDRGFSMT